MARRPILALVSTVLLGLAALSALAAIAAPATQAGGGCHGPVTPPGDGEASVVKIDGCMFYPTVARVPVGTSVRFVNSGDVPHNVTGVSGAWESGELASGEEYRQTFPAPGVYPFACTLHPGMNGAIVVGGDPSAHAAPAVTSTGGEAEASTATSATTGDTDPMALGVAALAGLGFGAIAGVLGSGAISSRRRQPTA